MCALDICILSTVDMFLKAEKRIFFEKTSPGFLCGATGLEKRNFKQLKIQGKLLFLYPLHQSSVWDSVIHLLPSGTCIIRFSSPGGESL